MEKKNYSTPELKTRRIELGVFGDYTNPGPDSRDKILPVPTDVLQDLHMRME